MTLQNWGTAILLLLFWGFYALGAGDLKSFLAQPGADGVALPAALDDEDVVEGLVVVFVWAYTDSNQAVGAFLGTPTCPFGAVDCSELRLLKFLWLWMLCSSSAVTVHLLQCFAPVQRLTNSLVIVHLHEAAFKSWMNTSLQS